jgi:hypothetical protein
MPLSRIILVVFVLFHSGCAYTHLRTQTVGQANTLNEIFEKQVLDNLAMFSVNPESFPSFAIPDSGASTVEGSSGIAGAAPLNPFFTTLGFDVRRGINTAWTLTPVTDPARLRLMKCAYQKAVGYTPTVCVNCCELEKEFFGPGYDCNHCQITCGFLCHSDSAWDIPKCCGTKFGHYCGHHVWVTAEGNESFSRLVALILDYAIYEPYLEIPSEKKVTFYLDSEYKPTTQDKAVGQVEGMIDMGAPPETLLARPSYQAGPEAATKSWMINRRPMERRDIIDMQRLRLRQEALAPNISRP